MSVEEHRDIPVLLADQALALGGQLPACGLISSEVLPLNWRELEFGEVVQLTSKDEGRVAQHVVVLAADSFIDNSVVLGDALANLFVP